MSSTISSATAVRSSLGPLTTAFTPPQECAIWGAIGTSTSLYGLWNGEGCFNSSILDTSTCWPSIASSISVARGAANGRGFYSPGLACPSGYTAACTAAQLPNGAPSPILSGNSIEFQFPLDPGETAIGCCPSGLSCYISNGAPQTCMEIVTSSSPQIGFCGDSVYGALSSITIPGVISYMDVSSLPYNVSWSSAYLYAPLFQLNWKNSDISPSTTTTSSRESTTSDQESETQSQLPVLTVHSIPISTPIATDQPSSEDNGISSSARIAIAISVPLGTIALAFLGGCLWLRKRRQRKAPMVAPREAPSLGGNMTLRSELDAMSPVSALEARKPFDMQNRGVWTRRNPT